MGQTEFPPCYWSFKSLNLCDDKSINEIVAAGKMIANESSQALKLVVIDTLASAIAGADENSFANMSKVIEGIHRIKAETGSAVLLVHHSGKDGGRGERGHSSLRAAADTVILVEKDQDGLIATVAKQRDFDCGLRFGFELKKIEVPIGETGETASSCALIGRELEEEVLSSKTRGPQDDDIRNCLREAIAEEGDLSKDMDGIPDGLRIVSTRNWRSKVLTTIYFDNPNGAKNFNRRFDALLATGELITDRNRKHVGFTPVLTPDLMH
jgi:hypothetical protein